MANLYRKPIVHTDPVTGEKKKTHAKKWWGQFKDADGRLRRHPLAADKLAALAMLNEMVRQVEREKAGLTDPTEKQRRRPLPCHVAEFRAYLENKGVSGSYVVAAARMIDKMAAGCKWNVIGDITAGSTLEFLGELRRQGRSAQTFNHYLKAAKQFTRWLVRDQRAMTDPLAHVSKLNVAIDRRHDRRALNAEEFDRLIAAAKIGKKIDGVCGSDRAMLYVMAAWTGFRKGELGSLTLSSFRMDATPPTVNVAACYSKRRRTDSQVLHPEVVRMLKAWFATKPKLAANELLFPISGRVPGGIERKTYKMMSRDLEKARQIWIREADCSEERQKRESSDFLAHKSHDGRYADFHSLRHYFITSLERSGVTPKMAQTLARHSDIRLTLGVYTHVGLNDQTAAILALPGPKVLAD